MPEAQLEDSGSGLAPVTEGWFVVNVRDTAWITSDTTGSACVFESEANSFQQLGVNVGVLGPGEPNCLYHSENQQEAFLVLSGECLLLVDGAERLLKPWDFFHCPAGTQHVFVGAGDQYMLPSIIAVVIGGTSLAGGTGGYIGTMAGAIVLVLLQSILTTLNIPPFGRQIIFGVTLLGLMLLYGRQRRLRG